MTMTMAVSALTAGVRPGRLVDVPAVVRLLVPEPPGNDDRASRALRLLLAHYLMEEGQVWVAEGGLGDTRVAAATIWLPSDARPAGTRLDGVLTRELRQPVDVVAAAGRRARAAFEAVRPEERHLTLTTAGLLGAAWDERRATGLLAPGLAVADRESVAVVAYTATERDTERLSRFGFTAPRHVTGPAGTNAWLTHRPARPPR